MATPVALTNVALQLGHGIGIAAHTVHDVILLVPAMAELHFKAAGGDHGGSDVVLRGGCLEPDYVKRHVLCSAKS